MARFKVVHAATDPRGPSWARLVGWATLGRSVEIVVIDRPDGTAAVEVRRWTGLRDDTDAAGTPSNHADAQPGVEYGCGCETDGTGDATP